ncbi:MAG: glutamate 5-kinase [Bauldia litoralis]
MKIGSALLVDRTGRLRADWLAGLAQDVAGLKAAGREIVIVSSGAIALGRSLLGLSALSLTLEQSQAAASAGQIALSQAWAEALGQHGIVTGQILITPNITEERRYYLNARTTIQTLLGLGAIPIINENDSVATAEIRYGDNDRLSARVATMIEADLLVLLSDIDGLYSAPPRDDPDARHLPMVDRVTPEIEAMAGSAGSELSRGGMLTKIEAAKIATSAGTAMLIASGHAGNPLRRIAGGERCTWFAAQTTPVRARKKWISGHVETQGALVVDDGAMKALRAGKSLLPAGVREIRGRFQRGDAVAIVGLAGAEIGRGLVAYDAADAERIAGRNSREIEAILGYAGRAEMIHRDDMALRGE